VQLKRRRHDVVFHLPLVVLSVRVAVETIFRNAYQNWFKLEEEEVVEEPIFGFSSPSSQAHMADGQGGSSGRPIGGGGAGGEHGSSTHTYSKKSPTMEKVQQVISRLFDPDHYNSHLSAFESTTEAIRLKSHQVHFESRHAANRLRDRYFTTSAIVQAMFPRPANGLSRKLLIENGGEAGGRGRANKLDAQAGLDPTGTWFNPKQFLSPTNRSKLMSVTLRKVQTRYNDSRSARMRERSVLLGRDSASPKSRTRPPQRTALGGRR